MLRYLSIVCTLLFMLQVSLNTLVFIHFKIQQEYISKEVCVQKNEFLNTCKGHCYLKAHLQKQDTDSDSTISYLKDKVDLYFTESDVQILTSYYMAKEMYGNIFHVIPIKLNSDIFHPPA